MNLKIHRKSIPGTYYFITKCCYKHLKLLIPDSRDFPDVLQIFHIFKFSLLFLEQKNIWKLIAFVMMPDHIHLIIQLGENKPLRAAIESLTKFVDREYQLRCKNRVKLWQKNYYKHVIEDRRSLEKHIRYVVENPIRKGFVENICSWPFSIIRE